jgi:hypothetical protein
VVLKAEHFPQTSSTFSIVTQAILDGSSGFNPKPLKPLSFLKNYVVCNLKDTNSASRSTTGRGAFAIFGFLSSDPRLSVHCLAKSPRTSFASIVTLNHSYVLSLSCLSPACRQREGDSNLKPGHRKTTKPKTCRRCVRIEGERNLTVQPTLTLPSSFVIIRFCLEKQSEKEYKDVGFGSYYLMFTQISKTYKYLRRTSASKVIEVFT